MTRIDSGIDLSGGRSAGTTFIIVFAFLLTGFFVGQFVAGIVAVVLAFLNGAELNELLNNAAVMYDYMSLTEALISQVLYTIIFTIVTPWFYLTVIAKKRFSELNLEGSTDKVSALLVILGTLSFMVVNSFFIEFNQNIQFPEFLSGFEDWARSLEDQLAEATERFTTFNNFGEFLIGFIAIALIPGIGEELLFRGVFQNSLQRLSKNKHVAIWVSAFIFGAIHMQFYGLIPRMLLGAVFGYLYVWSGNIWYPIIAHATNNGLAVIMAYSVSMTESDFNIDDTESFPLPAQIAAAVLFVVIMVVFRNRYLRPKRSE